MTDSIVVAVRMVLVVRRALLYELQGVQMTWQPNGVPAAECTLAVGRNEDGDTVRLDIDQGDQVDVLVTSTFGEEIVNGSTFPSFGTANPFTNFGALIRDRLGGSSFSIFRGVVDDWGPTTIQAGEFAVQVRCFGRLALLSSGTLQTNNITPKSYLDVKVNYAWGQAEDDREVLRVTEALGSTGYWPAVQESLLRVATTGPTEEAALTSSITRTIFNEFGTGINDEAASIIRDINGRLDWRGQVIPLVPAIVTHLNEQMRSNWFYGSFLESLVTMGEQLMFKVVEYGAPNVAGSSRGLGIVPYHPFWQRQETTEVILGPETWDSFEWAAEKFQSYAGAVLTTGTGQEAPGQGTGEDLIVGLGKIPSFRYGRVHVGPAPSVLSAATQAMVTGGNDQARGTGFAPQVRAAVGDYYARIKALELNYTSRRCRVSSPCVRTDIGPMTAVRIDFPRIPEVLSGTDAYSVYGSVLATTIVLDAARGTARTIFDVGYVRSRSQQQEIDRMDLVHPFFTSNYTGGRLDQDPVEQGDFDG